VELYSAVEDLCRDPAPKIMVFKALKRLRESGKIEMSRSMVVLRGG